MLRCAAVALFLLAAPTVLRAQTSTLRNDVMAVLSRAGCNSGACHGNLNGKGGFRLSLRGEDPAFDFASLTRDTLGRRLDRLRPDDSLVLAKPPARTAHEGGQRFAPSSQESAPVRRWCAQGAPLDPPGTPGCVRLAVGPRQRVLIEPADRVPLRVTATFRDGTRRDVTRLACFEPSNLLVRVEPDGTVRRLDHGETAVLVRYLDRQAVAQLAFVPARPG